MKTNNPKDIRRKSCTNDIFGGIHPFEKKTYNIKIKCQEELLEEHKQRIEVTVHRAR